MASRHKKRNATAKTPTATRQVFWPHLPPPPPPLTTCPPAAPARCERAMGREGAEGTAARAGERVR